SPAQWAPDNAADLDLGSMSPVVVGDRVLTVGKRGVGYLLDTQRLGGIGGQLTRAPVCAAFGGSAVSGSRCTSRAATAPARWRSAPLAGCRCAGKRRLHPTAPRPSVAARSG